jgi:acetyl esterase
MALPYPTLPGDVDRAVADDHAVVLRVLEHLESGGGDRRTLAAQLAHRFTVLAVGMEQVVFPELESYDVPVAAAGPVLAAPALSAAEPEPPSRGGASTITPDLTVGGARRSVREAVQEARTGQQNSKERIAVLTASEPGSAEFEQALLRLVEGARVHVAQIEGELLSALRLGADLQELGKRYAAAKRRAPGHPHPDAPDSPTASRLVAVATSVIDKFRDHSSGVADRLATDATGLLDADAQAAVDDWATYDPAPLDTLTVDEARQVRSLTQASELAERTTVAGVPVRIYRPLGLESAPVLVYAHGGGGVLGQAQDATPQALAEHGDCIVVSVDYRLAPEHPFPAAHEDVAAVLGWALGQGGQVAVAGESFGANLVAAACLGLDPEGPRPAVQLLITPLVTAAQDTPSMVDAAEAPYVGRPAVSWFLAHLFADPTDALDPRFAVLDAPSAALAQLPPTFVLTADRDPLRDQGEQFAARLADAGVDAKATRYDGVPSGFFGLGSEVQASVQAQTDAADALRSAFGSPALLDDLPL